MLRARYVFTDGQQRCIVAASFWTSNGMHAGRRRPFPGAFPFPPSSPSCLTRALTEDSASLATSGRQASGTAQETALNKFTNFALNSQHIPLGSMKNDQWLDILDAIDTWLRIGGGFSIHSAEYLLDRLFCELAVTHISGLPSDRFSNLLDAQLRVVQSWVETCSESDINSYLGLSKAQRALHRLMELSHIVDEKHSRTFPLDEFVGIVRGFLKLRTDKGIERASRLLLQITADVAESQLHSAEFAEKIGPLFAEVAGHFLTPNDHALEVLERMNSLQESGLWPEIKIPNSVERMLLESSLDRIDLNHSETDSWSHLSSFEREAMEKRLVDVLASTNDLGDVENLIQKLSNTQPSDKLITSLIEFFLRVGNAERASEWLQMLDTKSLVESNLIERIIESWSSQTGARIAWRADEVFKTVVTKVQLQGKRKFLNSRAFSKMISMWESTDDDSAADRKIVDWYSQMKAWEVQPETATLRVILQAAIRGNFESSIQIAAEDFSSRWNSLDSKEKADLAESILGVAECGGANVSTMLLLIDCFQHDENLLSQQLCRTFLNWLNSGSASASDVMRVFVSFGLPNGEIDLSLFTLAIQILFKVEMKPIAEVESVYDRALTVIQQNRSAIDDHEISKFVCDVVTMLVYRKLYSEAGSCLQKAENKLLTNAESSNNISVIQLECYKKLIVRKWYTETTAPRVERIFDRLLDLYRSGYSNLRPDCELYTGYIRALSAMGKDVDNPLNEMIDLWEATGKTAPLPSAEPFNTALLLYEQGADRGFNSSKKSIALLNRMDALGVTPDIKTLNLVLQNVTKWNKQNAYVNVSGLMARLEAYNLEPDSFTLHYILDACGSAPSDDRETALKKCLLTLLEIREKGFTGRTTYGITSRVIYRLLSKSPRADKVAASVMSRCREDGWFDSDIRNRLQSLMSSAAWAQQYTSDLPPDGHEPAEWSRNVQPDTSVSKETAA
jgi:hypothetical protein